MNVKQIDEKTALELAASGEEILIMMPMLPSLGWAGMKADTLQNILSGFLFFQEEAGAPVEVPDGISAGDYIRQEASGKGCDPTPEQKKDGRKEKAGQKQIKVDTGKLLALHDAGWSAKKIANEMRISEGTVWNRLNKLRAKEAEEVNDKQ